MQCQAVVDVNKKILNVSVGMPSSTNDSHVLRCSSLYRQASMSNSLFDAAYAQDGFSPFLLGDKGYPLYPRLLTPYRDLLGGRQSLAPSCSACYL